LLFIILPKKSLCNRVTFNKNMYLQYIGYQVSHIGPSLTLLVIFKVHYSLKSHKTKLPTVLENEYFNTNGKM